MRTRIRATCVALAVAVLAALAVAGCGGDDDDGGGSGKGVTLRLMSNENQQASTEAMVAEFEREHPNVKIEIQTLPRDQMTQLLLTQLKAGTAPDIFQALPGNQSPAAVYPLARAGHLLDLSGSPWEKDLKPEAVKEFASLEGKLYSLPLTMGVVGVMYNTELFDELGMEIPTTMDEMLALCEQARDADKMMLSAGFAAGAGSALTLGIQRVGGVVYAADPDWTEKRNANEVTFQGSPLWREALQSIVDMRDRGCFDENAKGLTDQQANAALANGDAVGSVLLNLQIQPVAEINPDLKYAFFNLPANEADKSAVYGVSAVSYSVNAATKDPDAAREFLDYLARPEIARKVAEAQGGIPLNDLQNGDVPEYAEPLMPLIEEGKFSVNSLANWPNAAAPMVLFEGITGLMTGQKSVDDVLKDLDGAWEAKQ